MWVFAFGDDSECFAHDSNPHEVGFFEYTWSQQLFTGFFLLQFAVSLFVSTSFVLFLFVKGRMIEMHATSHATNPMST